MGVISMNKESVSGQIRLSFSLLNFDQSVKISPTFVPSHCFDAEQPCKPSPRSCCQACLASRSLMEYIFYNVNSSGITCSVLLIRCIKLTIQLKCIITNCFHPETSVRESSWQYPADMYRTTEALLCRC